MIPGGGGSGQGPGRNPSRSTGTIPKIKSHNDVSLSFRQNQPLSRNVIPGRNPFASSCGNVYSQQKPSVVNVPKNQVPLGWPSAENTSPRVLHKNGPNNSFEPCRPVPDGYDSWGPGAPNNSYGLTSVRSFVHTELETNGYPETTLSSAQFDRTRMNGHDVALSSTSSCSSQTNNETCRNEIHLDQTRQCEQKKSNNIPRMNCSVDSSFSRSLQSPSLLVGQPSSMPMANTFPLNGQGDTVHKSSELNNRNELKMKLEEEERKLRALQEKQSVLLRRRKQMLNTTFDNHRSEDNGLGEVLHRDRAVDPNRSRIDSEPHSVHTNGPHSLHTYEPHSLHTNEPHPLHTNGRFVGDGMELRDGESSEDSAVEDSFDDYMDAHSRAQVQGQIVRDKLAEINCLRAQLKQVKGLITMTQRSPGTVTRAESADTLNSEFGPSSEQAVNIRRQRSSERSAQAVGNERGSANLRPDSKQSNASTKAEELELEKARLRHLQGLIARVQEFHSANLPIPEYLLAELKSETDEGSSPKPNTSAVVTNSAVETPISPSTQEGVRDEFVGYADENAFAVRHPETSVQQGCFSQEQQAKRSKSVNVEADFDHELDVATRGDIRPLEATFRRTGPSTTWENMTSSTPLSNEDGPIPTNVEGNETELLHHPTRYDQGCNCHQCSQRQHQPLDSQLQDFREDDDMHSRAPHVNQHNNATLPNATARGVWSSMPESEDISNSTNYPVDPSRYHDVRQENNSTSSSNVNLFDHAQEVQNRLRALAQSYQGLLTEGHMKVLSGNRPDHIYTAMMSNLSPPVNVPPPSSVATNNCDRDHYYQQLFAASQLQYQQVLVTAVNQCYHLLWLQHQELSSLRSTVHMLTSNAAQMSGIPQGQEPWGISPPSPVPVPPTLNNQVPPGNRTNNYWDNFRSYSRQNLLSAGQAKSNEVFPHNPSPLAQRSHNALHQNPPSNPVAHMSAASVTTASAIPMLSPVSGSPGQFLGAVAPTMASASFGPIPAAVSHQPEGLDVAGGPPAVPESTSICRKDKQNLAHQVHQNQQARNACNEAFRQSEVSSSGTCDIHPVSLSQETSPPDVELPMPMPVLRSHLSFYHRLSNSRAECPADVANRCADAPRPRNQVSSVASGEPDTNPGRTREGNWNPRQNDGASSWIGRRNWNNTSWTPNFQVDPQSAHSMPEFRFNNVSVPESQPGTTKRNSGIQKRSPGCFAANQSNYQRNIHGSGTIVQQQLPNPSRNISTPSYQHNNSSSNDCEPHSKLSKNQPGFESSRNLFSNQRSEGHTCRSFGAPSNSVYQESAEQDDQPMRCNSARHPNAVTLSESDLQSCEVNKNHLKENRLQMNRSPKCQSKPATPGSQGTQTLSGKSKSNQTASSSKRNQDSANKPSSTTHYPEDIREAVLAQVASLMSGNENQQFLTNLFRSLQLASSDPHSDNHSQFVNFGADSQQDEESTSTVHGVPGPEEDERTEVKDRKLRRGKRPTPQDRQSTSSHGLYDRACSLPECETRGASQNDSEDKFKDLAVELYAYIRAHLHDTCTSSMIEEICSLVLMFVPFARNPQSAGRSNPSQLEGLLENALHRFQGRRLEVVCDELTSVILKVLTNELSFVHLIDALDNNTHLEATSEINMTESVPHGWPHSESGAFPAGQVLSISGSAEVPSSPSLMREQDDVDLLEVALVAELASNGDLAEADQSHTSSLANGEVALNRSHRPDVLGVEDDESNAFGGGTSGGGATGGGVTNGCAVEENASHADSRPQSCEPCAGHDTLADRPRDPHRSASTVKEHSESDENGRAAGALNQEWEECSEDYQIAPQGIDHGLDQVPIRLGGEQLTNHTFTSSDSTSQ